MGQEISQQNKCNISRRHQHQHQQEPKEQQQHNCTIKDQHFPSDNNNNSNSNNNTNDKYTKHRDHTYTCSNISTTSSSTDDEFYRQRQKYNFSKQIYEKKKATKKLSIISATTTTTTTSEDTQTNFSANSKYSESQQHDRLSRNSGIYKSGLSQHQRNSSQSTDSGIYYSSCHCNSIPSSAASTCSVSTKSVCAPSVISSRSNKSLDKQKQYLNQHLYIKSYLDILEEDEKARAHYQPARPGGIRNYKPKILAEDSELATSAPPPSVGISTVKQHCKSKEDQWI